MNVFDVAFIVLLILKLLNLIAIDWWYVFAPLIVEIIFSAITFIFIDRF